MAAMPLAHDGLRGQIDRMVPNSASAMPTPHRMKYFQAASMRCGRAVEADHQHSGQRGAFHRHPQQADIVGEQRQQHGEDEDLVHAVVEAQVRGVSRPVSTSCSM